MSKNIGQIAGLFIGTTAPTNTTLIWYDSASHVHKVYNTALGAWTVLDQQAISEVTYSELVNRAATTGLTQGQWFKITDRSNALALAITSTKVQYADNSDALVINDLGTNIQYHVTSGNLLIDDIAGVYNTSTGKLVFSFEEGDPLMDTETANVDYVLAVSKRGNVRSLKKWKFSKMLSVNANNDISWANGFFLNFGAKLRTYFDVQGGVVSKETFDNFQITQQQIIQQIAEDEQAAIQQIGQTIVDATAPTQIYSKALPAAPTSGVATPIVQGDTLYTIINKIQRWIDQLRFATGIKVSSDFAPNPTADSISGTDSVDLALRKTQKNINILQDTDYSGETQKVGTTNVVVPTSNPSAITKDDTIKQAIQKLIYWVNHVVNSRIDKWTIEESRMALGVFNTDILRIDISCSDDLTGCGFGGVMIAGDRGLFTASQAFPNNPYRIATYWDAGHWDCPILAFSPVTLVVPNYEKQYTVASPMPHYKGHLGLDDDDWGSEPVETLFGAYLQSQIHLSQNKYDALYGAGKRYVKITCTKVDVYGANRTPAEQVTYLSLQRVNIWNLLFEVADFASTAEKHIIVQFSIEFTETNS